MTKVLLAVDGSDLARYAAARAIDLATNDARFTVAQVVRPAVAMDAMAAAGTVTPLVPDPIDEVTLREAADVEVAATVADLGIEADTCVVVGDPGHELCRLAAEGAYDLVVVGSHGSGLLKRALLGSVSHHVIHHAPCPVLVVREPA